ncbi:MULTISPECIES: TetR/AcrR family transcriptional regulator [Microbacterium]|uniref:DNA-binding transcriptional regulator, AcrR family n=1 Tax=Microbacterium saccharophilum TaxID=1213358 RepID=A0A7Z7CZW0_9MICO|nr:MULTISPECIES: TetR/AcrR family transcriptional regulator [Microbacterium]SFI78842.1 DNA-binding transcriptional regulator, AcrR family [Microbacterium saccharophilum]
MVNKRELQKETTRKRLLSTALDLFQSKGYVATTIDDIAVAAASTRVTFYAHFPSRRDIMLSLIDELNQILERGASDTGRSTASALVDAVRAGTADAIGPWLRTQAGRWPAIKPYLLSAAEAAAVDDEIRVVYENWADEVIADIADGLTAAGRYAPETHHMRGELAFGMLDRTAQHWMHHAWDIDTGPELGVLTEAWVKILGDGDAIAPS